VLASLEHLRARLESRLVRLPDEVTVVLHTSALSLSLAAPGVPLTWALSAPAARRYVAGWTGRREIHVLAPRLLERRASNVPGSREMLALAPAALYARLAVAESNPDLRGRWRPRRAVVPVRWAWLLEGGARWLAGQTDHARPAIARRLREGRAPAFPPGIRDAALLGGTIFDLLTREAGEPAALALASRLHPQGPAAALRSAFGGRALGDTEGVWRSHLARLATAP
jgi:hypothetical protein